MEELAQLSNASANFDEIAATGSPAAPLDFPKPRVARACRVTATIYNPASGEEASVPNVIYQEDARPLRAYWIGRKLKKAIYGCVRSCIILRPRQAAAQEGGQPPPPQGGASAASAGGGESSSITSWEVTSENGAVKIIDWNAVRNHQSRHTEDPIKEVSAMQFVGKAEHKNVIHTLDVLADDQYLYMFMPFCSCGELFGYVERDGRFLEPVARFWFRQIISGLYHLQKMGVCHRDLSLENLLVHEDTDCLVIDLGMCLRVPFAADDGSVTDVSEGMLRRLMTSQGQCGKPNYIAPEVLQNEEPFDGFGIDVWASGIILFIMLVGIPPFEWAHDEDPRFKMITRGNLAGMLAQWNRPISHDAAELLQNMLRKDPRDRLSLMEVMDHKWVVDEHVTAPRPLRGSEEWWN